MKFTFELVDWVKQILPSLRWVGFIQSGEDLNKTKRTKKAEGEGASLCLTLNFFFFSPLSSDLN